MTDARRRGFTPDSGRRMESTGDSGPGGEPAAGSRAPGTTPRAGRPEDAAVRSRPPGATPRAGRPEDAAAGSRVTLQDVADRAGVSLSTASRVVSEGPRRVGRQLALRVNQAVADLGYTANLQARAVATGQSTMVGVVVHDIADPYFSTIASGLMDIAHPLRLLVCLSSTTDHEAGEREYVALMRAQRARAVIIIGSRSDDAA